jgi:hypothetical protein
VIPTKKTKGKPGKSSPAVFAFDLSKASTPPKLHQRNTEGQSQNQKHHLKSKPSDSELERHQRVELPMLSSEPAPSSPRPWSSASGATPARIAFRLTCTCSQPGRNRTFLLCGE